MRWILLTVLLLTGCAVLTNILTELQESARAAADYSNICILEEKNETFFYDPQLDGKAVVGDTVIGTVEYGCVNLTMPCREVPAGAARIVPHNISAYNFSIELGTPNWCSSENIQLDAATRERAQLLAQMLPYVSNVNPDDTGIRERAKFLTRICPAYDHACKTSKLFYYVVDNYRYIADPDVGEYIKKPSTTIADGGGDCEDLGTLLQSYLEAVGVRTFTMLTVDHAYALACGIEPALLRRAIDQRYRHDNYLWYKDSGHLDNDYIRWYGPFKDINKHLSNATINIHADTSVDVFVFASEADIDSYLERHGYDYYPECTLEHKQNAAVRCPALDEGYLTVAASHGGSTFDLSVTGTYYDVPPEDTTITYYTIQNTTCIVLDPTTGNYSWPGYEGNLTPGPIHGIDRFSFEVHDLE